MIFFRIFPLLFLTLSTPVSGSESKPARNVGDFYGPEGLAILQNPDRIEACLLKENPERKLVERSKRKAVPKDLQGTVSALLSNNKTYGWGVTKYCLPDYGARLIFHRGDKQLMIDFCFSCNILSLSSNGAFAEEDFDSGRESILALFRGLFRGDRLIQETQ